MIALRKHSAYCDVLVYGEFQPVETKDAIIAYDRVYEGTTIRIICNFSSRRLPMDVEGKKILLSNYEMHDAQMFQPYECMAVIW